MIRKPFVFLLVLLLVSVSNTEKYNDWKNRGLHGHVKSIEQTFYSNLIFENNEWVLDSSKIYLKSRLIFDATGNIGMQIKDLKTSVGWQKLEYIYDYENDKLKSYTCISGKGKDIENCTFNFVNSHLLESRASLPNYEFMNETLHLNKDFRATKTIRTYYKKDKIEAEEEIVDEYNAKNEIMKTTLIHKSYINPIKFKSSTITNSYRINEKDKRQNWTSMAVWMDKEDKLLYYTTRKIEYYK